VILTYESASIIVLQDRRISRPKSRKGKSDGPHSDPFGIETRGECPSAGMRRGPNSRRFVDLLEQHRLADIRESAPIALRCDKWGIMMMVVGSILQVNVDLSPNAESKWRHTLIKGFRISPSYEPWSNRNADHETPISLNSSDIPLWRR
jgi:hypothetical protein